MCEIESKVKSQHTRGESGEKQKGSKIIHSFVEVALTKNILHEILYIYYILEGGAWKRESVSLGKVSEE